MEPENHSFTITIETTDLGNDLPMNAKTIRGKDHRDIHIVVIDYIFIIMEKGIFTMEKSLTKSLNLLPMTEKIDIMTPHDITHDLPRLFSLKSKYVGKPQTNPN